ncbi:MAG TPA: roadblock/LC7 domain-containing protein [Longimicrobiales bacterium]
MSDLYSAALDRLSRVPGVRGALLVETDAGVPVLAELAEGVEGGAVAALASSLFRRTNRAAQTAAFGSLRTLQLEADVGHVIVANGGELLIVVIAEKGAQLGMVRLEAHRAAEALQ